jgi:YD repeat-containing protein
MPQMQWLDGVIVYGNTDVEIDYSNDRAVRRDDNGKVIHGISPNGIEYWIEYNNDGQEIHYKNSSETEQWKQYDENGLITKFFDNSGWAADYAYKDGDMYYRISMHGMALSYHKVDPNGNTLSTDEAAFEQAVK